MDVLHARVDDMKCTVHQSLLSKFLNGRSRPKIVKYQVSQLFGNNSRRLRSPTGYMELWWFQWQIILNAENRIFSYIIKILQTTILRDHYTGFFVGQTHTGMCACKNDMCIFRRYMQLIHSYRGGQYLVLRSGPIVTQKWYITGPLWAIKGTLNM